MDDYIDDSLRRNITDDLVIEFEEVLNPRLMSRVVLELSSYTDLIILDHSIGNELL